MNFFDSSVSFVEAQWQQRLVQVCHPSLCPIFVMLVDNDSFEVTERKDGGFGSTGV